MFFRGAEWARVSVPLGKGVLCLHLGVKRDPWVGTTSQGVYSELGVVPVAPWEPGPVFLSRTPRLAEEAVGHLPRSQTEETGFGGAWKACVS